MGTSKTKKMVLAGLCVSLGLLLPQAMHAIPYAGQIFLPMHIPVLLCGFMCGGLWGLACGVLTPILSSLIFSMPPAPYLPGMVLELAIYGLAAGLLYRKLKLNIYVALVISMLAGRVAYGLMSTLLFIGGQGGEYSFGIFFTSLFVRALPGIAIQLVLLPLLVLGLQKAGVIEKPDKKTQQEQ